MNRPTRANRVVEVLRKALNRVESIGRGRRTDISVEHLPGQKSVEAIDDGERGVVEALGLGPRTHHATDVGRDYHHRGGIEIVGRDIEAALVGPWSRSISQGKGTSPQLPISAKSATAHSAYLMMLLRNFAPVGSIRVLLVSARSAQFDSSRARITPITSTATAPVR